MSDLTEKEGLPRSGRASTASSLLRYATQIQSALYRQAKGMIGPRLGAKYSASDAVQEAVLRVLRQDTSHPISADQQQTTRQQRFYRAVRDVVRNAVRHFRREGRSMDREIEWQATSSLQAALEPGRSASGLKAVDQRDQRDHVLSHLSPDEREVLLLRVEQQRSFEEMADALDCSVDAVKKRYYRAATHLKSVLDRLEQRNDRGSES